MAGFGRTLDRVTVSQKTATPAEVATGNRSAGPRSVERVTQTLQVLARLSPGISLANLARRLSVPKASLADILAGLLATDFVLKTPDGRYRLGPNALRFARRAISTVSFSDYSHHHLKTLVERVNETALVARLDEENMTAVYVDKVESNHPIHYSVPIGLHRELYAAAAGKVLLAHLPQHEQTAYLRSATLKPFTSRTIVDRTAIATALSEIRHTGIAVTVDERSIGASAVAAPILDSEGLAIAALVVAGPTPRILEAQDQLSSLVRETAERISATFGSSEATVELPQ